MTTKTYSIHAGYLDSILDSCRSREGHETMEAALSALAQVAGEDASDLVTYDMDGGGTLVYRTQEQCDADEDGSSALATIAEVAVALTRCHGCGEEVTESMAVRPSGTDAYCPGCHAAPSEA